MKRVIVNADDLGIAASANGAILQSLDRGILTSASLMVTTAGYEDALTRVVRARPHLGVGLHCSLTCGRAVSPAGRIPLLVDAQGTFIHGFLGLWRLMRSTHRAAAGDQIEFELRAQFEKALDGGVPLDHVDGHQHVHMIPGIWPCVTSLASEYDAGHVRVSDERFVWGRRTWTASLRNVLRLNPAKKFLLSRFAAQHRRDANELNAGVSNRGKSIAGRSSADQSSGEQRSCRGSKTGGLNAGQFNTAQQDIDASSTFPVDRVGESRQVCQFVGVLDSGRMDAMTLERTFATLEEGLSEVLSHPGAGPDASQAAECIVSESERLSEADARFLASPDRVRELEALLDPRLRVQLDRLGIQRTTFAAAFSSDDSEQTTCGESG
jgi:predicted glycoside hydrolase/deacetylase ChbG (UPF0249 family)